MQGLATDAAGNVYITGGFQGPMNPGNGLLVSAGNEDVFLVRLAANGNANWAKRFGDGTTQVGRGLAIDGAGRVTIVGEMAGSVDFGGGAGISGALVGFVAQFESDGTHQWSKLLCDTGGAQPLNVATDGVGSVLVTANSAAAR